MLAGAQASDAVAHFTNRIVDGLDYRHLECAFVCLTDPQRSDERGRALQLPNVQLAFPPCHTSGGRSLATNLFVVRVGSDVLLAAVSRDATDSAEALGGQLPEGKGAPITKHTMGTRRLLWRLHGLRDGLGRHRRRDPRQRVQGYHPQLHGGAGGDAAASAPTRPTPLRTWATPHSSITTRSRNMFASA